MAAYKGHPAWLGKAMQTGGAVDKSPLNPGEVSDAASRDYLRGKAFGEAGKGAAKVVGGSAAMGTGLGALKGLKNIGRLGPVGKALGAAGSLLGAGLTAQGVKDIAGERTENAVDTAREADKFNPKKRGGRTKKKD